MPDDPDAPNRDYRRSRDIPPNLLAEVLGGILSPEARKVLRNVAEETTYAALRAGGGPNPLAAATAAAARLLSDATQHRPAAGPTPGARSTAEVLGDEPTRLDGVGPAQTTVPAPAAAGSFARLAQPGTDWWQFVRPEAVVAVKSPAHDRCVVMLADGRELEVGGSTDTVARQIPGLVRLTQPGTQRCLYVRPSAVVAVTAPSQGCVLHLSNGRDLEAGEAAAAAANLIAGAG